MSNDPIPIIICGKNADMAAAVKKGLEPEVEVIHIILSLESALHDIPQILNGEKSSTIAASPRLPTAVVLGGGYSDAMISSLRDVCKDVSNKVPWLQQDYSKPMEVPPGSPGYLERVVEGVKEVLIRLRDEGKDVGDEICYY